MKSSEVCIKTRSNPALLIIQGQVPKHIAVKWAIAMLLPHVQKLELRRYFLQLNANLL